MAISRKKMEKAAYFIRSKMVPEIAQSYCSNETQTMFMEVLKEAKKLFKVKISNIAVLEDEFKMVIKNADISDISHFIQWVKQVFSIRFNRRFNRSGTIWNGRFKSILLNKSVPVNRLIENQFVK